MKLKKMNKSLIGIFVAVAAVSCSDELVNNDGLRPAGGEYSDDISFVVYDNNSATRGGSTESRRCGGAYLLNTAGTDSLYMQMEVSDIPSPLPTRGSDLTLGNIADISMTCRMRTNGSNYNHYFTNLTFSKSDEKTDEGTFIWKSEQSYYWLDANTHFNFYGYAPADAKGVEYNSNSDSNYIPTLDYTVPETASEQIDLVYHDQTINTSNYETNTGYDFEYIANAKQLVPLNMKHALSKVIFKTGDGMAAGTIKSVTIKNVYDHGTLDLSTGKWDIDKTSKKDFTIKKEISGDNQAINEDTDGTYFFLLPYTEGTEEQKELDVDIKFLPAGATSEEEAINYTGKLSYNWEAGKQYVYTITITPEYEFNFEIENDKIDAHYDKFSVNITPSGVEENSEWTLSCNLSGVTFLSDYDYNNKSEYSLLKEGFWTDRMFDSNNNVIGSARGENSIIFKGDSPQKIWVFVPENTSSTDRPITLNISINEKNFTCEQVSQFAAFGENDGWEQIDEKLKGAYGYSWNNKVSYQLVYSLDNTFGSSRESYCNNMINLNDAASYSSSREFRYSGLDYRWSIIIDYSKLSNIEIAQSQDDGLTNTIELFEFDKGASTKAFENVLLHTMKTENGKETEKAFRKMKESDLYDPIFGSKEDWSIYYIEGTDTVTGSDGLASVLKKNKYDIKKTGDTYVSYTPMIESKDIVWYLPAKNEFNNIPSTLNDPIEKSQCWSSTLIVNSSSSESKQAYLGSGVSEYRNNIYTIRVRRKKP